MDRGLFWTGGAIYVPPYFLKKYLTMFDKMLPDVIARVNAT